MLVVSNPVLAESPTRPNILLVMADDLGFSDLGCYGSEIQTPNLDRLAANGVRLTHFYNTARCWPTRAALMTGFYAQQVRRDTIDGVKSGNRGIRPNWAPLISARLKAEGYRTYHSGKWHLDGMPLDAKNGFDHSYYLKDQGRFFSPKLHYQDDQKLPAIERGSNYYGTTAIAQAAIEHLQDHAHNHAQSPFFYYLAFTAPHFPLMALPEDIAKYETTYNVGWDVIRQQRWQRQREMGLTSGKLSDVESEVGPPYDFPEAIEQLGPGEINRPSSWNYLTAEQQQFQSRKMAIHAAMIDRMDQELGRVLSQLQQMDAMHNTLVLFLSDNGASAEIMVRADGHDPTAEMGSASSYLCLGPGWSTACNTPFRRHKTWVHQGGIATPLIVHWPEKIKQGGVLNSQLAHVVDIVPTIMDQLAIKSAGPEFAGSSFAELFDRPSMLPEKARTLWWCHEENKALRIGDWKAVCAKGQPWELYNLRADPNETHDLAASNSDRLKQLVEQWKQQWDSYAQQASETFVP